MRVLSSGKVTAREFYNADIKIAPIRLSAGRNTLVSLAG